jgi:hypothetical protein
MGRQEAMEVIAAATKRREAAEKKQKEQREVAGGSTDTCAKCGQIGEELKRCTGCYMENYCSKACQRTACGGHKAVCRQVREQFRPVLLRPVALLRAQLEAGHKNHFGAEYAKPKEPKSKFPVQVDVQQNPGGPPGPVIIRNEDRSVFGKLERSPGQEGVYDRLVKTVQEQGVQRGFGSYQAYYYALYQSTTEEGGYKIEINAEKPDFIQIW